MYIYIYIKKALEVVYISYSKLDIANKQIVEVKDKRTEVVVDQYN